MKSLEEIRLELENISDEMFDYNKTKEQQADKIYDLTTEIAEHIDVLNKMIKL